jgi:CBS domain-containing protein
MEELLAKHIMTKKVITINKDATVGELLELLIGNKISGVPVIDEKGTLVGMATEDDIIAQQADFHFPLSFSFAFLDSLGKYERNTKEYLETKVEEIMTSEVKVAKESMPVSEVVTIMVNNNVNRVPVVDKSNKLKGIIARADILKSMIKRSKQK